MTKLDGRHGIRIAIEIALLHREVENMNRLLRLQHAAEVRATAQRRAFALLGERGRRVVGGGEAEHLAVAQIHIAEIGVADAHCVFQQSLKHRFELARGAGNDLQHLGGRCLLRRRFGPSLVQLVPACFELLFRIGAGWARPTNASFRLRSGRTKLATSRWALDAFARQGHPRNPSIYPGSPGRRPLKHNMPGPVGEAI